MTAPATHDPAPTSIWLVIDGDLVPVVPPPRRRRWWQQPIRPDTPIDALVPLDQPTQHWVDDLVTLDAALSLITRLKNEPVKSTLIAATRSAVEATAPTSIPTHIDVPAGAPR